jgi:hypothetical protein
MLFFRPPCLNTFLNFAGFSVLVALDANRLARAFSGARVGRSSLTPNGKAADMPDPPITTDRLQALQVSLNLPSQITFNEQAAPINRMHDLAQLLRGQVLCANVWINVSLF